MRQTHWIGTCYRLEDAEKIGALVGVRPFPWENLPLFRVRLLSTVAARLKGALGPNEIRDFVYRYLHDTEATMGASLVPGLQTVTAADAYKADPSRPLFRPLAFEENPPAPRESSILASRGGNVPYLFRWQEKNQGLDETLARIDVTGVIDKRTTTPVVANLTTGDLVGFRGAIGFGRVLTIAAAGTDAAQPRRATAALDGTDVTASLFSVSGFEMGEPLRLDRIDPAPLVPRLVRGANEFVFLSVGMFSVKGLNRYFSSTAADDLREAVFDETRFDHTLFPSGRVARVAMSWYETQGATFEVRVPRYIVREPSGSQLHEQAARVARPLPAVCRDPAPAHDRGNAVDLPRAGARLGRGERGADLRRRLRRDAARRRVVRVISVGAEMRGKLAMVVRGADGELVAERRARNIVLRQGASIVARLFSGAADGSPITHVQVGFARESATPETTALTPPQVAVSPAALRTELPPGSFQVIGDQPAAIKVLVNATFHPTVELKDVSEAGLMAGTVLYNQVVFEPVTFRPGQDVTFFWEVDFPFGR
jgi:hypothetical protein